MLATDYSVRFSEQSDTMSLVSTWLLYQTFEFRQSRQIRFDSFISNVQICGQYRFTRPARDERLDSFRSTWYAGFQWFFRSQTFQYVIVEGGKNTNEQIFFQSMPPLSTVPTVTRTHHHTTFHRVLTTLCRHNRGANSLRSWMHACMQYVEDSPIINRVYFRQRTPHRPFTQWSPRGNSHVIEASRLCHMAFSNMPNTCTVVWQRHIQSWPPLFTLLTSSMKNIGTSDDPVLKAFHRVWFGQYYI